MNPIEQAINDMIDNGRPTCCLAEDVHEAFFMPIEAARNLVQVVLFQREAQ